jgi:aminoglycoside phosphotransferase (APT) family kinase protein
LACWLAEQLPQARAPFVATQLAGGNSNLTYRLADAGGRQWALRRPPEGAALATAHDVRREARIMQSLEPAGFPVPAVRAICSDETVLGSPFVLMDFVAGPPCRTGAEAAELSAAQRHRAGIGLATTAAGLHALDPEAIGLGDLGRHQGYLTRQLSRWHTQWRADQQRELPQLESAFAALCDRIPAQTRVGIVHGDYRLDNTILAADGSVAAVLDWELCTLGDPLADLGVLLAYWAEPGDPICALQDPPTLVGGFPTRSELRTAYLDASGQDLAESVIDYYVAFAWWKLACIVEGVYARATRRPAATGRSAASYAEQASRLAEHADELARALP